jgi:hypothetical protein
MKMAIGAPWTAWNAHALRRQHMPLGASRQLLGSKGLRAEPLPQRRFRRSLGTARRQAQRLARPQAALYHLPDDLQSSLQTGLGIAWMLALPFSALPILTGESKEMNEQRYARPNADQSTENVRWTVMGVLSFIPFLNWLVRVLGRWG